MTPTLPERPAATALPEGSGAFRASPAAADTRPGPMAGRTVLVTGGTSGIGRATAAGLAPMGSRLAITGRDHERAEEAAREIRMSTGAQVDVFIADSRQPHPIRHESAI